MDIIQCVFKTFNFSDENVEVQISLRDPKNYAVVASQRRERSGNTTKYIGSDEDWATAEQAIIDACEEKGMKARKEVGEAAFYGPKLDLPLRSRLLLVTPSAFMVKDAIGRRWQLGTIQVDYQLPQRFQLEYIGEDNVRRRSRADRREWNVNQKHRPVMIHRAPFGSMERFVAVLIEHTAGKFPLWLTPDQVAILPVSEKYVEYAQRVLSDLASASVRAIIDDRNEKIGRKIRDNEIKHIPYMLVVGEKEQEEGTVAVRKQGGEALGTMPLADFAKLICDEVAEQTAAC